MRAGTFLKNSTLGKMETVTVVYCMCIIFLNSALDVLCDAFYGHGSFATKEMENMTYVDNDARRETSEDSYVVLTVASCTAVIAASCCGLCGLILSLVFIRRMIRQYSTHAHDDKRCSRV